MGAGPLDAMPRQAVEHLLHTARRHLGMEGAFLAELTETHQIYQATSDLGDRDVAVLEALADTLAFHVAQLEDSTERIVELEAHAEELTRAVR